MKLLYIARHAKSSWKHPELDDFDRPLNKRGKRDAPRMGHYLKQQKVQIDCIVTSPARRAIKTARHYAEALALPRKALIADREIYDAGRESLLERIRKWDDAFDRVMLVGHNPGLTELANDLAHAGIENIPTAGIVTIELPVKSWSEVRPGCGRCLSFVYPKTLFAD